MGVLNVLLPVSHSLVIAAQHIEEGIEHFDLLHRPA